jgi:hypothetical protein
MPTDLLKLRDFAMRYTAAWCSQNPSSVAALYSYNGSLTVNDDPPAVGRDPITEVAQSFMSAFPDLCVVMDDLVLQGDQAEYLLDSHRHQYRARRHRPQGPRQRPREMAFGIRRLDCLLTGAL